MFQDTNGLPPECEGANIPNAFVLVAPTQKR